MSFQSDMVRFEKEVMGQSEKVIRQAAAAMFSRIVRATPVDEGTAKGNWQVGVNSTPDGPIERDDEGAALAEISLKTAQFTLADSLHFANSLPYIRRLESGWSGQAPAGMVATNIEDWGRVVESIARKHRT